MQHCRECGDYIYRARARRVAICPACRRLMRKWFLVGGAIVGAIVKILETIL